MLVAALILLDSRLLADGLCHKLIAELQIIGEVAFAMVLGAEFKRGGEGIMPCGPYNNSKLGFDRQSFIKFHLADSNHVMKKTA